MLTWMGFIGKLVEFMTTKLIGKQVDIALDKKKKACKAFIGFYDSLVTLELLFGELIKFLESFVAGKNSRIYDVHLRRVTGGLAEATDEFIRSLKDLCPTVYLYDPALARLFGQLRHSKRGFSLMLSYFFRKESELEGLLPEEELIELRGESLAMKFEALQTDNPYFRNIHFTMPSDELINTDFEEHYEWIKKRKMDIALDIFEKFDLAQDLLVSLTNGKVIEDFVGYEDKEKLIALYPKLISHKDLLSQACESLRVFIRQQFSLEDLLHVVK